jgi:hypothetical protein
MPREGIRTHGPNNQAAADLRLIPRGHWDQKQFTDIPIKN